MISLENLPNLKISVNTTEICNDVQVIMNEDEITQPDSGFVKEDFPYSCYCNNKEQCKCGLKNLSLEVIDNLFASVGINDRFGKYEQEQLKVRFNVVHVHGLEDIGNDELIAYFTRFGPIKIEWINDHSCNIVFTRESNAFKTLLHMSVPAKDSLVASVFKTSNDKIESQNNNHDENSDVDIDVKAWTKRVKDKEQELMQTDDNSMAKLINVTTNKQETNIQVEKPDDKSLSINYKWRQGIDIPSGVKYLLLRYANRSDVKCRGAHVHSKFYQKYGNPHFGGARGILSKSFRERFRPGGRKVVNARIFDFEAQEKLDYEDINKDCGNMNDEEFAKLRESKRCPLVSMRLVSDDLEAGRVKVKSAKSRLSEDFMRKRSGNLRKSPILDRVTSTRTSGLLSHRQKIRKDAQVTSSNSDLRDLLSSRRAANDVNDVTGSRNNKRRAAVISNYRSYYDHDDRRTHNYDNGNADDHRRSHDNSDSDNDGIISAKRLQVSLYNDTLASGRSHKKPTDKNEGRISALLRVGDRIMYDDSEDFNHRYGKTRKSRESGTRTKRITRRHDDFYDQQDDLNYEDERKRDEIGVHHIAASFSRHDEPSPRRVTQNSKASRTRVLNNMSKARQLTSIEQQQVSAAARSMSYTSSSSSLSGSYSYSSYTSSSSSSSTMSDSSSMMSSSDSDSTTSSSTSSSMKSGKKVGHKKLGHNVQSAVKMTKQHTESREERRNDKTQLNGDDKRHKKKQRSASNSRHQRKE